MSTRFSKGLVVFQYTGKKVVHWTNGKRTRRTFQESVAIPTKDIVRVKWSEDQGSLFVLLKNDTYSIVQGADFSETLSMFRDFVIGFPSDATHLEADTNRLPNLIKHIVEYNRSSKKD